STRFETDFGMRAVAEGLRRAAAAAAQARARHSSHDATGAARDLEVAAHRKRSVRLRLDRQHAITHWQHVSLAAGRFSRGGESDVVMRAIAKRLVLGGSAAAQSSPIALRPPLNL